MCKRATVPILIATVLLAGLGQAQAPPPSSNWRHIGNWVVEKSLAGPASGPVARVWYSQDGATLFLQTGAGRFYQTADRENWRPSIAAPPPMPATALVPQVPVDGDRFHMIRWHFGDARGTKLETPSRGRRAEQASEPWNGWNKPCRPGGRLDLGIDTNAASAAAP